MNLKDILKDLNIATTDLREVTEAMWVQWALDQLEIKAPLSYQEQVQNKMLKK